MNSKIFVGIAIMIILLSGCFEPPKPDPEPATKLDDSKATAKRVKELVNGNNQLALELYSEINEEGENLFFSPWSISSALGMTFEGARGTTAEEMQSVLHYPKDDLTRRAAFAKLFNTINKPDKEYELKTANALWAQEDYKFLDEYLNINKQYYLAEVRNMDFKTKTEESRKTINQWIEEQTNNKIKDLIPAENLNPLTRLVLTNAIYFKGKWLKQFDKAETKQADFKVSPEKTIKVPMMYLKEDEDGFNYAETDELQMLEMPYKGENLSMLVLLPKNSVEEIEGMLSAEKLKEWKSLMNDYDVEVYFPKFKFETKYFMKETFENMGMPNAFSYDADFSGMTGTKNLYVSNVIHQAFVEVNEEGTEAAAATAVVMYHRAMSIEPPKEFRADRPFIFLIQEKETGSILFMGKVANPLEG